MNIFIKPYSESKFIFEKSRAQIYAGLFSVACKTGFIIIP